MHYLETGGLLIRLCKDIQIQVSLIHVMLRHTKQKLEKAFCRLSEYTSQLSMQAGLEIDTIEDTVFCYCDTMCCELCYLSFIKANFVQNITTVKNTA